jgi:hypothetical protein
MGKGPTIFGFGQISRGLTVENQKNLNIVSRAKVNSDI